MVDDQQYIPKYIKEKPWYKEGEQGDSLSHQRKNPNEVVDYSLPIAGTGFQNQKFDSKRDRWENFEIKHYDDILKNWQQQSDEESDDTTYELEVNELGLQPLDIKRNVKQDKFEKIIRDRNDIPNYIKNISNVVENQWVKSKDSPKQKDSEHDEIIPTKETKQLENHSQNRHQLDSPEIEQREDVEPENQVVHNEVAKKLKKNLKLLKYL